MVSITDKQAERLFEIIRAAAPLLLKLVLQLADLLFELVDVRQPV